MSDDEKGELWGVMDILRTVFLFVIMMGAVRSCLDVRAIREASEGRSLGSPAGNLNVDDLEKRIEILEHSVDALVTKRIDGGPEDRLMSEVEKALMESDAKSVTITLNGAPPRAPQLK